MASQRNRRPVQTSFWDATMDARRSKSWSEWWRMTLFAVLAGLAPAAGIAAVYLLVHLLR
jgi:hypothetical protein